MPSLLIRHTVTNYEAWRPTFDEHVASQRAYGSRGGRVFRSDDDPTEIWILLEWDDLSRARLYARSVDLHEVLTQDGEAGPPEYWCLEEFSGFSPESASEQGPDRR